MFGFSPEWNWKAWLLIKCLYFHSHLFYLVWIIFSLSFSQRYIICLTNHLPGYFSLLSLSASDSITQHSWYDCVLPWILGHTLHYSLYIRLGGEISFCLSTLCHLTLDEISHRTEMHSANTLAMPAHELWVKWKNKTVSLCTANECNVGDDTVLGFAKKSVTPTSFQLSYSRTDLTNSFSQLVAEYFVLYCCELKACMHIYQILWLKKKTKKKHLTPPTISSP